jgi:hypothetical protein
MDNSNFDEMAAEFSTLAQPYNKGHLGGVLGNVDAA